MIMKGFYTSPVDDKTLTLKSGNYSLKTSITCFYKKKDVFYLLEHFMLSMMVSISYLNYISINSLD